VTTILAELGMDTTTLVAALLHDTVEDTRYTSTTCARSSASTSGTSWTGSRSSTRCSSATRRGRDDPQDGRGDGRDPRVLVIKLADRLHNMRTLRWLQQEKQERIARQTLEIFAPLAHRLGMNTLKWELEDLGLRRPSTPSGTTRSSGWWPSARRPATPSWPRCWTGSGPI
jgi:GTP pyrophosphokinase